MNQPTISPRTENEVSAASTLMDLEHEGSKQPSSEARTVPVENTQDMKTTTTETPTKKKRVRSKRKNRHFPTTLFEIIQDRSNSDIIQWTSSGAAFIICDKKRFAAEILPRYFKEAQYTSFTRKLSRWGFLRVSKGKSVGAYYHKLFLRSAPDLCRLMLCNSQNYAPPEKTSPPPSDSRASNDVDDESPTPMQSPTIAPTVPSPSINLTALRNNQSSLQDLESMTRAREELIVSSQLRELRSKKIEHLMRLQEIEYLKKEYKKAQRKQLMSLVMSRNSIRPSISQQLNTESDNLNLMRISLEHERLRLLEKQVMAAKLAVSQMSMQSSAGYSSFSMTPSTLDHQQHQVRLHPQDMHHQHNYSQSSGSSRTSRELNFTRARAA